ncbi:MAG: MBL fold metallo-hydrolase [Candidatus Saccharimonadales bacterium]|nr:MBL fold metallo-hydrolase [Candidatus Saccharimonadales bacterium]
MKITKYVHSCVLVETPDRVALFDPGGWSWESGVFDLDKIDRIDRIAITHEHGDHFSPDFVKAVLAKFPQAHVIANEAVTAAVRSAGIEATFRGQETGCLKPFEAPHAPIEPFGPTPSNNGFHFQDLFTHPGDSHQFIESKKVLAMPFIAPWGRIPDAVKLVQKLKPKYVLPIHDWHYTEEATKWAYGAMKEYMLGPQGIEVLTPAPGEPLELD